MIRIEHISRNHYKFQLTTSRRGRRSIRTRMYTANYFNSLPHAEVDHQSEISMQLLRYFNSLPHAEVDGETMFVKLTSGIFQLTTSRRGRLRSVPLSLSGDSFQLTTSRRGRRLARTTSAPNKVISTHYLTQR